MSKGVILYTVLVIIGLGSFNANADNITFDANESPPFWSKNAPFNGMCGELVYTLSKMIGVEAKINFQPLQRLIDNEHNNDLGDPSFYIKNQDFSAIIPIAIFQNAFHYYRPNHLHELQLENWHDLIGFKVGILKGGLEQRAFFSELGIQFEESYTQESLIKKLELGRLDLIIEINLVAKQMIKELFPEEVTNFYSIPIRDSITPIAMMIDSDFPNARQLGIQYKEALAKIIKNGTYYKIIEKYYGKDQVPKNWFTDMNKFQRLYRFIEVE